MDKQKTDEPRNMKIRRATAYDVVNLAKMLVKGRDEQAQKIWYPEVPRGPAGEEIQVRYLIDVISRGLVFVADLEGRLMGAIGMTVQKFGWSNEWVLLNEWFYVLPQFRDYSEEQEAELEDGQPRSIARALLAAVEAWADADIEPRSGQPKDALGIVLGIWSGERTGIKDRFMKQLGYNDGGGSFMRAPLPMRATHEQQELNNRQERDSELARERQSASG